MRNFKKITFGIFIVPLLLIFQSVSYSEKMTQPVTYHYEFAPLTAGINWERYIPGEDAPISFHFSFDLQPPQLTGKIDAEITLDSENHTLRVKPGRTDKPDNPFVGKFESKGGVDIGAALILDFTLPHILTENVLGLGDIQINHRIDLEQVFEDVNAAFAAAKEAKKIKDKLRAPKDPETGEEETGNPLSGIVNLPGVKISVASRETLEAGLNAEADFNSLLLETNEFVQLNLGIPELFVIAIDAVEIAGQFIPGGAALKAINAAEKTVPTKEVIDILLDTLQGGIEVYGGFKSPLTLSGAGIYLDSLLATSEDEPVKACGLDPDLGFYGIAPDGESYAVSTSYVGSLTASFDLTFGADAFFKFAPLKIPLLSYDAGIAETDFHIADKTFPLNFKPEEPVTFPVDVDKLLETDSEFARDFPRLPQWHLTDGAKARLGGGSIAAIAYSPDGCQLAVAGWDGFISLYNSNVGSGEKREFLSRFGGLHDNIRSLSFSPDGKMLASGGSGLWLWDVATGSIITPLSHSSDIQSLSFSPDGKTLASGSRKDGSVKLWDVATRTEIATISHSRSIRSLSLSSRHEGTILATAASPDSRRSGGGSVKLWDGATGTEIATLLLGEDRQTVYSVAFSPDGTILATADNYHNGSYRVGDVGGGRVRLWDGATGTAIATLLQDEDPNDEKHSPSVYSIAFSPDGKTLAAGGGNLYLWDVTEKKYSPPIANPPVIGGIQDITFSPDGTTLSGVTGHWGMRSWGVYRKSDEAFLTEVGTLRENRGTTERVRFGPDSKTLVSFDDHGARLWDADAGKEIATLFYTEDNIMGENIGDFSPDGKTLALIFRRDRNPEIGNLELWDAEARTRKRTLGSPTLPVVSVAFSRDSKMIAGGREDGIVVWNVETGAEIATLPYDHFVLNVAFSPNGKILAGSDQKDTVKLWNVATETEIATLSFETAPRRGGPNRNTGSITTRLSFDRDNKILAVSSVNYGVTLWDAETGKYITTLSKEREIVRSVAFSRDGKTLASCNMEGAVKLWDVATETRKATFWTNTRDGARSVHFSPDGKTLATAAETGTVLLWDLTTINTGTEIATLPSHKFWVSGVAFSRDGKTLASVGDGGAVKLWDIDNDKQTLKTTIETRASYLSDVALSRDEKTLASGGSGLALWDITTEAKISDLPAHSHIYSVAFTRDGKTLASGDKEGNVQLWDVEARSLKATFTGHIGKDSSAVFSVAFSRDGETLASGGRDGIVRLWDTASYTEIATLAEYTRWVGAITEVSSVAFTRDGKTLASLHPAPGIVKLWDVETQTVKARLTHDKVGSGGELRFSPDGKTLASGHSRDVVLWDVATGAVKAKLTADGTVHSLDFSPDGKTIASGYSYGADGLVKLWDITSAVESSSATPLLVADVNADGIVNIQDLVTVAAALGQTGEDAADVNGDGAVNIQDLVAVAAALGEVAAAPSAIRQQTPAYLTTADVQHWLILAQGLDIKNPTTQRGILFLQYLFAVLTPQETALLPNYPNPFNPETWIPYQLAKPAEVTVHIYAVNGVLLRTLALGHLPAGHYHGKNRAAYWDGRNAVGEPVASGVYFYTLTAGDFAATRKMLILK